jgi:hypothetical protein
MAGMNTLVVYRGHDNPVSVRLETYDETQRKMIPLDLSGVDRMVLVLTNSDPLIVFDSNALPLTIDWSVGDGEVYFQISGYDIPIGIYEATLVAYSLNAPNGYVLVSDGLRDTTFDVRNPDAGASGGEPPPGPPDTFVNSFNGRTGHVILQIEDVLSVLGYVPLPADVTRMAGETVSALKVVYELDGQVFPLSADDAAHIDLLAGITTTSATTSEDVVVQRLGTIDDAGWSWTPGRVWLGLAGVLTQIPPLTGFDVLIGNAVSATRLILNIQDPVTLE